MIYAESPRLILRSLEKSDLPRIVDLIGDWDVARWLPSVPHPYTLLHAEEFFLRMAAAAEKDAPEYFLIEHSHDAEQIGAIGLHPPREAGSAAGELMIGYWLGKDYWRQGFMSEAVAAIIDYAFRRSRDTILTSTTDPTNNASQNVLRRAGFSYLGITAHQPNDTYSKPLRGSEDVTRWRLTHADYKKLKGAA